MMGNAAEYLTSNPYNFDINPSPTTDPQAKLDQTKFMASTDGPFFVWPSILRSGRFPDATSLLDLEGRPTRISVAVGRGFRLVRTVSPSEAAAW